MSSKRITLVLDTDQDAALCDQLVSLARTGDMSLTVRAALYAYLSPKSDLSTIMAELASLRADVMTAIRSAPQEVPPGSEDRILAAVLDEQLDNFFQEDV